MPIEPVRPSTIISRSRPAWARARPRTSTPAGGVTPKKASKLGAAWRSSISSPSTVRRPAASARCRNSVRSGLYTMSTTTALAGVSARRAAGPAPPPRPRDVALITRPAWASRASSSSSEAASTTPPSLAEEGDGLGPGEGAVDDADLRRPGQGQGGRRAPRRAAGAQDHHRRGGQVEARRLDGDGPDQARPVGVVGRDRSVGLEDQQVGRAGQLGQVAAAVGAGQGLLLERNGDVEAPDRAAPQALDEGLEAVLAGAKGTYAAFSPAAAIQALWITGLIEWRIGWPQTPATMAAPVTLMPRGLHAGEENRTGPRRAGRGWRNSRRRCGRTSARPRPRGSSSRPRTGCPARCAQIAVQPGVAERAHRQLRGLDHPPDRPAVASHHHGRVQLVDLAAQFLQPLAGGLDRVDLVEQGAVQVQGLVRADHQAGALGRDLERLQLGQGVGDFARRGALGQQAGLGGVLVDARADRLEDDAGVAQDRLAGRAFGQQRVIGVIPAPRPGRGRPTAG
jgi:hypothetical protein